MTRKLTALLLALLLVLSLAACGAKKEEAPAEKPEVETETPAPETPNVEIEVEETDPDVGVPAEPAEEPDVMPEMPAVSPEMPAPEVEPEAPAEKPVETPAAPPAEGSVDLTAFYTSLQDTYGENFPANMNLCEMQEMLDGFYPGLSAISTRQMLVYQPMMGAVVCEIALIEVENAADVEAVKAILQTRIDEQVAGGAWYPESIEGWKNNSRIVVNGSCVMMIAYSDCDAVVEAFNGLF